MKIVIVDKTTGKGGYQARVYGNRNLSVFAKSEQEALQQLAERILSSNGKIGKTGQGLYRIYSQEEYEK